MRAKVTKAFRGAPDGAIHPRQIEVGEIIEGDLARVAIDENWAKEVKGAEPSSKAKRGKNSATADELDDLSDADFVKVVHAELVPADIPQDADRAAVTAIIRAKRQQGE
ncbi:hypothetical protein OHD62_17345 [Mesorhizobium sp. YC-39]|uniref:hypothetical protein n=1 Tax=unclassified Mesorhizobium TaxID=325217 RepID=UPI0021E7ABDF|nr:MULTISPECIES: hypothetical protein [unclassified Mesorhizobium]MCV3209609.1 hypothetical protein [Mesorhizobium sp. YC-2]MCV3230139.1 hypothetical protein [Mesorhizobium sp. YC-39]